MKQTRGHFRDALRIDPDDLDSCLVNHAQLYESVADASAMAVSRRDTVALELEEALAEVDSKVRAEFARKKEKFTEAQVRSRSSIMPQIKELQRQLLSARLDASQWSALEKSFHSREAMLRKLVDLQVNKLNAISAERGTSAGRAALRDGIVARAERLRANRPYADRYRRKDAQ